MADESSVDQLTKITEGSDREAPETYTFDEFKSEFEAPMRAILYAGIGAALIQDAKTVDEGMARLYYLGVFRDTEARHFARDNPVYSPDKIPIGDLMKYDAVMATVQGQHERGALSTSQYQSMLSWATNADGVENEIIFDMALQSMALAATGGALGVARAATGAAGTTLRRTAITPGLSKNTPTAIKTGLTGGPAHLANMGPLQILRAFMVGGTGATRAALGIPGASSRLFLRTAGGAMGKLGQKNWVQSVVNGLREAGTGRKIWQAGVGYTTVVGGGFTALEIWANAMQPEILEEMELEAAAEAALLTGQRAVQGPTAPGATPVDPALYASSARYTGQAIDYAESLGRITPEEAQTRRTELAAGAPVPAGFGEKGQGGSINGYAPPPGPGSQDLAYTEDPYIGFDFEGGAETAESQQWWGSMPYKLLKYKQSQVPGTINGLSEAALEDFQAQAINAGLIDPDAIPGYLYGHVNQADFEAMGSIMYNSNISRDPQMDWRTMLGLMEEEGLRRAKTEDARDPFMWNTYTPMDPATYKDVAYSAIRGQLGREPNEWEMRLLVDSMAGDHRAEFDRAETQRYEDWMRDGRLNEAWEPTLNEEEMIERAYSDEGYLPGRDPSLSTPPQFIRDASATNAPQIDWRAQFNNQFRDKFKNELARRRRVDVVAEKSGNLMSGMRRITEAMR